jgi:hypothetical protein
MADPNPLERLTLRLDRAEEHLKTFDTDLRRFLKKRPYEFLPPEHHPEIKQVWYHVKVKGQPPTECSVPVGDALHNMRAALDNLVYALAVKESGEEVPPFHDKIAFPIHDDPKFWKPNGQKIGAIPSRAKTIIESLQPYHRRKTPHQHPLWVLQKLNNIDKHRFLHVVGMVVSNADIDFSKSVAGIRFWLTDQPLKRDAVIAKIDYSRAKTNVPGGSPKQSVDMDLRFGVSVCFDEPGVNAIDSAQVILEDDLLAYLRGAVIAKLSPFLA